MNSQSTLDDYLTSSEKEKLERVEEILGFFRQRMPRRKTFSWRMKFREFTTSQNESQFYIDGIDSNISDGLKASFTNERLAEYLDYCEDIAFYIEADGIKLRFYKALLIVPVLYAFTILASGKYVGDEFMVKVHLTIFVIVAIPCAVLQWIDLSVSLEKRFVEVSSLIARRIVR